MPRLKSRILISQSCLWTSWWRTWCWQLWKVGEDQWADACTGISVSGSLFPILRMPTFSEDIGMEESWGFVQISDILCSRNPLQGRFQESEKPFTLTLQTWILQLKMIQQLIFGLDIFVWFVFTSAMDKNIYYEKKESSGNYVYLTFIEKFVMALYLF